MAQSKHWMRPIKITIIIHLICSIPQIIIINNNWKFYWIYQENNKINKSHVYGARLVNLLVHIITAKSHLKRPNDGLAINSTFNSFTLKSQRKWPRFFGAFLNWLLFDFMKKMQETLQFSLSLLSDFRKIVYWDMGVPMNWFIMLK